MLLPVSFRQFPSDVFKLIRKQEIRGATVFPDEHFRDSFNVMRFKLPQANLTGIGALARVRYIEHIPQARLIAGIVQQGDTLGAAPDITPHSLIPQIKFRAGCCIRALSENHELIVVIVLIHSCRRGQIVRPCPMVTDNILRGLAGQLRIDQ